MESLLSELEQLPWPALVEEARRRGIPAPDAMDRETLIEAIRARERSGSRGPLSLARSLLGRVVDTVRAALPTERRSDRPPPPSVRPRAEPPRADALPPEAARSLQDEALRGVRVIDDGTSLAVVWRVTPEHLERAEAIAPPGAEMHLHSVRVSWPEHATDPQNRREDHGVVRGEGAIALPPRAPDEKIVVAIGLAGPDGEFVAIEHATHG